VFGEKYGACIRVLNKVLNAVKVNSVESAWVQVLGTHDEKHGDGGNGSGNSVLSGGERCESGVCRGEKDGEEEREECEWKNEELVGEKSGEEREDGEGDESEEEGIKETWMGKGSVQCVKGEGEAMEEMSEGLI